MAEGRLSIRAARASDAASILEIYSPYVYETAVSFEVEPPGPLAMAERILANSRTHPWLVAESGAQVIGYAYAAPHSQRPGYRWTVNATIYIQQDARRRGIGGALYAVLLEVLRRQGFRSVFAEIVLPHPASVELHERFGFQKIGVHKDVGYKLGGWRDIGYWRLGLCDGAAPPSNPIPFADYQQTTSFLDLLT